MRASHKAAQKGHVDLGEASNAVRPLPPYLGPTLGVGFRAYLLSRSVPSSQRRKGLLSAAPRKKEYKLTSLCSVAKFTGMPLTILAPGGSIFRPRRGTEDAASPRSLAAVIHRWGCCFLENADRWLSCRGRWAWETKLQPSASANRQHRGKKPIITPLKIIVGTFECHFFSSLRKGTFYSGFKK